MTSRPLRTAKIQDLEAEFRTRTADHAFLGQLAAELAHRSTKSAARLRGRWSTYWWVLRRRFRCPGRCLPIASRKQPCLPPEAHVVQLLNAFASLVGSTHQPRGCNVGLHNGIEAILAGLSHPPLRESALSRCQPLLPDFHRRPRGNPFGSTMLRSTFAHHASATRSDAGGREVRSEYRTFATHLSPPAASIVDARCLFTHHSAMSTISTSP